MRSRATAQSCFIFLTFGFHGLRARHNGHRCNYWTSGTDCGLWGRTVSQDEFLYTFTVMNGAEPKPPICERYGGHRFVVIQPLDNPLKDDDNAAQHMDELIRGQCYSRDEIAAQFGGSAVEYLPTVKGRVVCACLRPDLNPDAPQVILVGRGPIIEGSADLLCGQRDPIPVFIKQQANEWKFVGHYAVERGSQAAEEIVRHQTAAGRSDVTRVIHLRETSPNQSAGKDDSGQPQGHQRIMAESAKEFLRRMPAVVSQSYEIDLFVTCLREALGRVGDRYYGGVQIESGSSPLLPKSTQERKTVLEYLRRYHERVFCYELYHQLRMLMDASTNRFGGVFLQAELRKDRIGRAVEQFLQVRALDKEYLPDFLLHSPGNAEQQYVVIEVKCDPNLSFAGMKKDLKKIQQFIERYRYQLGIFLTVNTSAAEMEGILRKPGSLQWIRENLHDKESIIIMCGGGRTNRPREFRVDQLAQ